jgi:hypothetical protein
LTRLVLILHEDIIHIESVGSIKMLMDWVKTQVPTRRMYHWNSLAKRCRFGISSNITCLFMYICTLLWYFDVILWHAPTYKLTCLYLWCFGGTLWHAPTYKLKCIYLWYLACQLAGLGSPIFLLAIQVSTP